MRENMDIRKVMVGIGVGCLFLFCFVRDIKVGDVAEELVKAEVQQKINETKAKVDSVKADAIEKHKKKFKLFKRLVPKKEAK